MLTRDCAGSGSPTSSLELTSRGASDFGPPSRNTHRMVLPVASRQASNFADRLAPHPSFVHVMKSPLPTISAAPVASWTALEEPFHTRPR
jgi:hypothetical protein